MHRRIMIVAVPTRAIAVAVQIARGQHVERSSDIDQSISHVLVWSADTQVMGGRRQRRFELVDRGEGRATRMNAIAPDT